MCTCRALVIFFAPMYSVTGKVFGLLHGLTRDGFPSYSALWWRLRQNLARSSDSLKLHGYALDIRIHGARSGWAVSSFADCASGVASSFTSWWWDSRTLRSASVRTW